MPVATQTHGGYLITGDPKFPQLKRIKPDGKGSVPKDLSGLYTSFTNAMNAIDNRVAEKQKEVQAKAEKTRAKRKRLLMETEDAPEENTTVRDEPVRQGPGDGGEPS